MGKKILEILEETVVDKISSGLESIVNVIVGFGVVDTNTKSVLDFSHVEEVREVLRRSRVITGVSDIVGSSARVLVVRSFDIVSAHILGFGAEGLSGKVVLTRFSGFAAVLDGFEASAVHVQGELHVVVDGIVDCLDAIGVVDGKLGVVGSLDSLVDDAVSNAEGVEVELDARNGSVGDELVLVVEVVEKRRSCHYGMSAD